MQALTVWLEALKGLNLNRRSVACNGSVALLLCHMLHFNTREAFAIEVDRGGSKRAAMLWRYIIISLADKIELAFKSDPIMVRRKGAVRSVCHTVLDLPVGDELCNDSLSSLGQVVNVSIAVPLECKSTEGACGEESAEVDEIELPGRLIR